MIKPVKASFQGGAAIGRRSLAARHVVAAPSPAVAGFRPAGVALAVAAAFMGVGTAFGQPTGAQAIQGQAFLQQQGTSLLVTTQNAVGTNRSVINWQSFSIPAGSTTQFLQPTAQSLSINRVTGNDPSAIYGTLSSNGRLVLVNPSGIAVGAGAVVDTAGFTASTLKMSDADAMAGRLVFGDGLAGGAAVQVDGRIIAHSGDIVLIAPNVQAGPQAIMQAPNGATVLAAGQKVELTGRGLEGIVMQVQAPGNQAVNLGTLQGDAVGIFAGTLKHSGLIQANAVSTDGGKVVLRATGDALVDGRIEAKAGDKGGSVDVLGNNVALYGSGSIDASGANGGGTVRVGGDWHGANPDVPNANSAFVGSGTTINADATQSGSGGSVVVWSNNATRFYGQASARGGAAGGNGGSAEVSGKNYLEYAGNVDLRASKGATGQLLLDPNDISIDNSATDTTSQGPIFEGGDGAAHDGSSHVNVGTLQTQLGTSDILIRTSSGSNGSQGGTITVANAIAWSSSHELQLDADNNIALDAPITAANGTLGLRAVNSITQANSAPITVATLGVSAGNTVTLNAPNQIGVFTASGGSGSGNLSLTNAGPLTIDWYDSLFYSQGVTWNGPVTIMTTGAGSLLTLNYDVVANGGNPLVINSSGGVVTPTGNIGTDGGSVTVTASAGDIDLQNSVVYSNGGAISIGAAAGSILG
ncbi:MAG TPA: filamentous hemagglutinin N-terminal domain-containing protein, partial [Ramlibacter sp.]